MRIHLLGIPSTQTTQDYALDGFTQATIRFARILKMIGHTVFLYAGEENEAPCDELVTCVSKQEQEQLLNGCPYQYAAEYNCLPLWELVNPRMAAAIAERKEPRDTICTIGGTSQQPVTGAHPDLMTVEYSIGYGGSYAAHRVFESHVWRHYTHGVQGEPHGRFYDTVIPLFFDVSEFPYREKKEPFALYVGRLTYNKGITVACEAAKLAGVPLKVIGHGDASLVTHGAEYLGALDVAKRNAFMGRASVLLCPTLYLEPFGAAAVEAQLCGTPVVSTDFGAFTETIEQGVTGFRCNYKGEFAEAIKCAQTLDPVAIRNRADRLYSLEAAARQYDRYLKRVATLWDKGWDTIRI